MVLHIIKTNQLITIDCSEVRLAMVQDEHGNIGIREEIKNKNNDVYCINGEPSQAVSIHKERQRM